MSKSTNQSNQSQGKQKSSPRAKVGNAIEAFSKAILAGLSVPYEGTFGKWLQHGATELANMALHGHAAPVYSHSMSPSETPQPEQSMVQAEQVVAPETKEPSKGHSAAQESSTPQVTAHGSPSTEASHPTSSVHGPSQLEAPKPQSDKGILADYMNQLASYEPQVSQEQELSR